MKKNGKRKDIIIPSTANIVLPISLVLGLYVILHGHLSPGGGFQGGVLVASAVAILFLAYGPEKLKKTFKLEVLKVSENIGALCFVLVASLGLIYGAGFFNNFIHDSGALGQLYSSGTIFFMNLSVGYKVLAGIGVLILVMVEALKSDDDDKAEE